MIACTMSAHAEKRSNQRGIRQRVIECLLDYGASAPAGNGCEKIFMTSACRKALRKDIGRTAYAQVEHALDCYVVVSPHGAVVTCGHRLGRIQH